MLIIGGVLTVFGPLVGLAGTVWGMIGAFDSMGHAGAADPENLSAEIGVVLHSTAIGFVLGLVGVCTLIGAFFVWISSRRGNPDEFE